jgi:hypothetical protein
VQNERLVRAVVLNNLAYVDAVLGDSNLSAEAQRYSEEAIATLGWHPSIKGTRGAVLLEAGKIDEAIPLLSKAMESHEDPRNKAQNACWLAIAQARKGDLTTSRKLLDAAIKLDSTCFLLDRARTACGECAETRLQEPGDTRN